MRGLRHPTVESVIAIHSEVLMAHGGTPGLRSRELLESAIAAPQATMLGNPLLTDPFEIAAAYFLYLCSNHAFVDGNERVALATCLVFLSENGLLTNEILDVDAWESLTLGVASNALFSRTELSDKLRALTR
jgi:death-on-curing protein